MAKFIFKTILWLLPILVIIGLFRVAIHGAQDVAFLPSYEELVSMFANAPDFLSILTDEIAEVQASFDNVSTSFGDLGGMDVHDLISFFEAIGRFFESVGVFFEAIGEVFKLIFVAVSTPVQLLVWLITNVLGLNVAQV